MSAEQFAMSKFASRQDRDDAMLAEIERLRAEVAGLREDAERLEFIQNEYLHIIPFAMPTGADDSEVGWQVHIEAMNPADGFRHTEYRDNLRAAIDAARKGEA